MKAYDSQTNDLNMKNVSKNFEGVDAVKDVSLVLRKRESCAIIGPNGAGKTTLFNLITGEVRVDKGRIMLFGIDITDSPIQKRSELGLGRTYQISNLFLALTVEESLFLALRDRKWSNLKGLSYAFKSWKRFKGQRSRVEEVAQSVGLAEKLDFVVSDLSHGQQRQLELGIAIASDPKIILLDEPMSGLSSEERNSMKLLIKKLASERTTLVIEHDMDFAFSGIFEKIIVLHQGSIITSGDPEEIRTNEDVKKIYNIQI